MIWSEAILNQYIADASINIVEQIPCLYHRFYMASVVGTATYQLPAKVQQVLEISWHGQRLEEISWMEFEQFDSRIDSINEKAPNSKPYAYALHPSDRKTIALYPTPNESFLDTGGDPYAPVRNEQRWTISCYRYPDDSSPISSIPKYTARRLIKAYVLWKAYGKEGVGQNLKASEFYKSKYLFILSYFAKINSGAWTVITSALTDGTSVMRRRPARPSLPSNFERVELH